MTSAQARCVPGTAKLRSAGTKSTLSQISIVAVMLWNTTAAPADEACAVSNSPSFVSLEISGDTNCGTVSLHPKEGSRKQVSGSELSSAIKWLVENGPNLTSIAIRDLAISGDVALDGLHPTQSILFERDEILGTLRISSLKSSGTLFLNRHSGVEEYCDGRLPISSRVWKRGKRFRRFCRGRTKNRRAVITFARPL